MSRPRAAPVAPASGARDDSRPGPRATSPDCSTVLVVDDEPAILVAVEQTLNSYGIDAVHTAHDGVVAVDILRREPVSVVLMDFTMPGLAGFKLLDAFAAARPEVPIVVVTAIDDMATAVSCMQRGAIDYVVKPVRPQDLIRATHNAQEICRIRHEKALLDRQVERMALLGRLATGIVHDFRNLFQIVAASCELAERKLTRETELQPHLERARRAAEAAAVSARRLLEHAQAAEPVRRVVDLGEQVAAFAAFFTPLAPRGIRVETGPAVRGLPVLLCVDDLRQALLNLSLNALDAMPAGGTLALRVGLAPAAGAHTAVQVIDAPRSDAAAYIELQDTGRGMDADMIERFRSGYPGWRIGVDGRGLGLSIIGEIVRNNDGGLAVETQAGAGTLVRLLFPIARD